MSSTQSDFLFYMSMLNPIDFLTVIFLAGIALVVGREEEVSLKYIFWNVMVAAMIPLYVWSLLCKGMDFPGWVRYAGMFVIWATVLIQSEAFNLLGATLASAVLVGINAGGHALTHTALSQSSAAVSSPIARLLDLPAATELPSKVSIKMPVSRRPVKRPATATPGTARKAGKQDVSYEPQFQT